MARRIDERPARANRKRKSIGAETTFFDDTSEYAVLGRLCKGFTDWVVGPHVGLMRRFELTDAHWEQSVPLLPRHRPRTGRPAEDCRQVLNGVLWILRMGVLWEDLPAHYDPVGTVSSRFYRWRKAGVFDQVVYSRTYFVPQPVIP